MAKKSETLIPKIIKANSREDAINILKETIQMLNLSNEYVALNEVKDILEEHKRTLKEITDRNRELAAPRCYEDVNDLRLELSFLYRDVSDALSYKVNSSKIFFENDRTAVRADAILAMASNEEVQDKVKAKSPSALREIYGATKEYKEYSNNASISYGLYKELEGLLNAIKMQSDALSSEAKYLLTIKITDVK